MLYRGDGLIEEIKKRIVNKWILQSLIQADDRELYEYGVELTLESVINNSTTIFLALMTGEIFPCLCFYISFMLLRSYSGGAHARNFIRCYCYSSLTILSVLVLIKYDAVDIWIYRILVIISTIYLFVTQPVASENKEVTGKEQVFFSHRKRVILFGIILFILVAIFLGFAKIEKGLESTVIITGISGFVVFLKKNIFSLDIRKGKEKCYRMEKMIKVAICDDNTTYAEEIEKSIKNEEQTVAEPIYIKRYISGNTLLQAMEGFECFDIVFMDIQLERENGIEIAGQIKQKYPEIILIYISNHYERVFDAFKTEPLNFIRKFYKEEEIGQTFLRAVNKIKRENVITVKCMRQYETIKVKDIMYISSEARLIKIYVKDGKEYLVYDKLDEYENMLKQYAEFIRIHKSYLINFDYMKKYDVTKIEMKNGRMFNVSRDRRDAVREKYLSLKFTK